MIFPRPTKVFPVIWLLLASKRDIAATLPSRVPVLVIVFPLITLPEPLMNLSHPLDYLFILLLVILAVELSKEIPLPLFWIIFPNDITISGSTKINRMTKPLDCVIIDIAVLDTI